MPSVSAVIASGSTNGRPKKIAAIVVGSADTLHTASATAVDQVAVVLNNTGTVRRKVTLLPGGTTSPDDYFPVYVDPAVPYRVEFDLTGSVILKAFAEAANEITASLTVRRITP